MKAEMEMTLKIGVGGLIGGAIIAMIIGFNWGGWSTAGATQKISDQAVLTSHVEICVAQFVNDSNSTKNLADIAKSENYLRSDFIEKGGWDKMPGQKEAGRGVASACADGVSLLIKP